MERNTCLLNILKSTLDDCKLRRRKNVTYFVYNKNDSLAVFTYTDYEYTHIGTFGRPLYDVISDFVPLDSELTNREWDEIVSKVIKYAREKVKNRSLCQNTK